MAKSRTDDEPLPLVAPPDVASVADQLQLGPMLERAGREDNVRRFALFLIGSGIVSLVLSCVALLPGRKLFIIALMLFAYGLVGPVAGTLQLVRRTPQLFLYEGGIVEKRGTKVRSMRWSDVAGWEVQIWGDRAMFRGRIKGYVFRLHNGEKLRIPSGDALDMKSPFENRMVELARAAGLAPTQTVANV
jgi:hypothetical protein